MAISSEEQKYMAGQEFPEIFTSDEVNNLKVNELLNQLQKPAIIATLRYVGQLHVPRSTIT